MSSISPSPTGPLVLRPNIVTDDQGDREWPLPASSRLHSLSIRQRRTPAQEFGVTRHTTDLAAMALHERRQLLPGYPASYPASYPI